MDGRGSRVEGLGPARWRDDALVAWLSSRGDGREEETLESSAAVGGQDVVDDIDGAFDVLGVALGALVGRLRH